MVRQTMFRAMGTEAHLMTVGGDPAGQDLESARRLVDDFERRWSRFRPESEVSRLNRANGHAVAVDADTYGLVAAAVDAWHLTAGRFDPTVLHALVSAGYDRSFEQLAPDRPPTRKTRPAPAVPGCAGIVFVPGVNLVRLPEGAALDLGGIAKGHTADRAALGLTEAGAAGAMANLGGDVRVVGTPPEGSVWPVAVDDPLHPGRDLVVLMVTEGAVATSSRLRRRWRRDGRTWHHVIDPATGEPASGDVDAAVVLAADAAWAEVLAKSVVVAGAELGAELLSSFGVTGLVVLADGSTRYFDGLEAFLA